MYNTYNLLVYQRCGSVHDHVNLLNSIRSTHVHWGKPGFVHRTILTLMKYSRVSKPYKYSGSSLEKLRELLAGFDPSGWQCLAYSGLFADRLITLGLPRGVLCQGTVSQL